MKENLSFFISKERTVATSLKEKLIFEKYIKEQKEKNNINSIFTEISIYNNNINSNSIFKVEQEKWLKDAMNANNNNIEIQAIEGKPKK